MAKNENWTREQTIIAFNLYCSIPFGQAHSRNKEVQKVAKIIGRSAGAVARKLGNFGSLDPELKKRGVGGLANRSKLDEIIWDEFHHDWNKLAFESTSLIAEFKHESIEDVLSIDMADLPKGVDKIRSVKTRVYQDFFRTAVFAAYENTCCITGIRIPLLQIASHIVPWSKDEKNRTNPQNGLCINALHDKAFDKGIISIRPDYTIAISKNLDDFEEHKWIKDNFYRYEKKKMHRPHKFLPDKLFLEYHYENIFRK